MRKIEHKNWYVVVRQATANDVGRHHPVVNYLVKTHNPTLFGTEEIYGVLYGNKVFSSSNRRMNEFKTNPDHEYSKCVELTMEQFTQLTSEQQDMFPIF
jgi:hypothetical protein